VSVSLGIHPPTSFRHIFGNWLIGADVRTKKFILTGVSALCWAIWLSRNDVVFNKVPMFTYLQVLYRATHWFRFWAQMQKSDGDKEIIKEACHQLEVVAMQIYANFGWRFTYRISSY
jgi:hypothetical protein